MQFMRYGYHAFYIQKICIYIAAWVHYKTTHNQSDNVKYPTQQQETLPLNVENVSRIDVIHFRCWVSQQVPQSITRSHIEPNHLRPCSSSKMSLFRQQMSWKEQQLQWKRQFCHCSLLELPQAKLLYRKECQGHCKRKAARRKKLTLELQICQRCQVYQHLKSMTQLQYWECRR